MSDTSTEADAPDDDIAPPHPPLALKAVAALVLVLMASAMGWLGWTIVTYWDRVGV